jgi:hypothetical protein
MTRVTNSLQKHGKDERTIAAEVSKIIFQNRLYFAAKVLVNHLKK